MKIINNGRGIHVREIPGIEKLKALPENWLAFTNLDVSLPGIGMRELDVVLVLDDRLMLIDLKDWKGPIQSKDGNWFNGPYDNGRSPVAKISEVARELHPLMKRFLADEAKKEGGQVTGSPFIQSVVVLTKSRDRSGISDSEISSVFDIDYFIRTISKPVDRIKVFGPRWYDDFTSEKWLKRFKKFFNVNEGIFQPGTRRYGGYSAKHESPTFTHKSEIYAEYDVEEVAVANSYGLLRRWDFSKADTRFQSEEGRSEIAGREKRVIAWLDDRNPRCGEILLKSKIEDSERGVGYWEIFERRRRMFRLIDFIRAEIRDRTENERIELARQVLSAVASVHSLNTAHLDIGFHSVWVEMPTMVKLSHLMVASMPEIESLGQSRFQFLSSSSTPEDVIGGAVDPFRKDVFQLACVVHALLFDVHPKGDPPEWRVEVDPEGKFSGLHPWFERCLDIEQENRYSNAREMLNAFNEAFLFSRGGARLIERLDSYRNYKSQREILRAYPELELIKEDNRVIVWRSEFDGSPVIVKLWYGNALGNIEQEQQRILAFLDNAQELIEAPLAGAAQLKRVHWTGDAIALVQDYVPGRTLANIIENSLFGSFDSVRVFLSALIDIVENFHARTVAHGDIKPDNIIVDTSNESNPIPVLIDLVDFTTVADGSRNSRAYCPNSGGRFERDRYAITRIAEELIALVSLPVPRIDDIKRAIGECRDGPPHNGTLLPLREALQKVDTPFIEHPSKYAFYSTWMEAGPFLADEGQYAIVRQEKRYIIVGATERLSFELDDSGSPSRAWRDSEDQGRLSILKKKSFVSFRGDISVENGENNFDDLIKILEIPDVLSALSSSGPNSTDEDDGDENSLVLEFEASEDELAEKEQAEKHSILVDVDVPYLWERLIEGESDFKTEAIALDDSIYKQELRMHFVPIQLSLGSMDFDHKDVVIVEKLDARAYWKKVGVMDIRQSTAEVLAIQGYSGGANYSAMRDGDRLRFQSRMENTSLERRKEATSRLMRRNSVNPNLIDSFQPASGCRPRSLGLDLDNLSLSEKYRLNATQIEAFKNILNARPLGLLQGPPGTGKTYFIGALVHYALTHGIARNVLIASQSHEAVNNAAEAVLKCFGDDRDDLNMIRVGAEGQVSESLRSYHVATVEKAYKDNFVATKNQKLLASGRHLGLTSEVCEDVIYYEETLYPILLRISDYADDPNQEMRLNSLKGTVQHCLLDRGIECSFENVGLASVHDYVEELYFSFFDRSLSHLIERFRQIIDLTRDIVGTVSTWQRSYETFLAGTRQVVAGTCVGLGRSSLGLTKTAFDLVIVDEAARCTPSELAVPIQAGKWVVLVGDHAQLEPLHPGNLVEGVANELNIPLNEVVKSDFERIFESHYGSAAGSTLKLQYRMLPPIGRLVSNSFYGRVLQHGRTESIVPEDILPEELVSPLAWVSTDSMGSEAHQKSGGIKNGSLQNPVEAEVIVTLLKRWSEHASFLKWLRSYKEGETVIGIICAYSAQLDLIRQKLRSENLPEDFRARIKVDTIDSYQGKENLIVVLSLVRNNYLGGKENQRDMIKPGFMAKKNRINVAMSRAMDRLLIVGAKMGWREMSPLGIVSRGFDEEVKAGEATLIDAAQLLSIASSSRDINTVSSNVIQDAGVKA